MLSSRLVSDSESVSKPITMFVSDIIGLCGHAYLFVSFPLPFKWELFKCFFFYSHSLSAQDCSRSAHGTHSTLGNATFLCVLHHMQLHRSNYTEFESTDTPMSQAR